MNYVNNTAIYVLSTAALIIDCIYYTVKCEFRLLLAYFYMSLGYLIDCSSMHIKNTISYFVIHTFMATIHSRIFSVSTENATATFNLEKNSIGSKSQKSHNTDLSNASIYRRERNSSDFQNINLHYDPVLLNNSAIKDYLNRKNEKVNYESSNLTKTMLTHSNTSTHQNCSGPCEQSLCSWNMHWDEDVSRIPQFIRYAKCKWNECDFQFAKLDPVAAFTLEIYTHCETVTTDIFVKKDGEDTWLTDWPIACMCAKTMMHKSMYPHDDSKANATNHLITSQPMLHSGSRARLGNNHKQSENNEIEKNKVPDAGNISFIPLQRRRLLRQLRLRQQRSDQLIKSQVKQMSEFHDSR